jgi:hypothetical protein
MDYGNGYIKTTDYPAANYPWLSFAQISQYPSIAQPFKDNGVKTIVYTYGLQVVGGPTPEDPYWTDLGGSGSNPSAPSFLHDCAGNSLVIANGEATLDWYALDWSNAATPAAYRTAYTDKDDAGSLYDYWFIDGNLDIDVMVDEVSHQKVPPCVGGSPMSDDTFRAGLKQGLAQLGKPVLVNGLSATNWQVGQPCDCIDVAEAVDGARMEGSYVCPGNGQGGCANQAPSGAGYSESINHPIWQSAENTELQMANAHKILMIQGYDKNVDPTTDTGKAHRLFYWASWFLVYDLDTTVAWYGANGFSTDQRASNPSGVRIYPESQVVMKTPVVPQPTNAEGIDKLKKGGVYAREYKDCYLKGKRVGSCVTAVNADETASHPFPIAGYGASNASAQLLVLNNGTGTMDGENGAETINGGFVTVDGGPAPAMMASDTGVIVFDTSR